MTATSEGLRSSAVLLDAWDVASAAPDVARGAVVLATVSGLEAHALVDVPLAEVTDLALRCLVDSFGDSLDVVLRCQACGEQLEVSLPLAPYVVDGPPMTASRVAVPGTPVAVRPPTTRDLLATVGTSDPAGTMLRRCTEVEAGQALDDDSLRRAAETLDLVTGGALAALVCTCPACDASVEGVLDACALLWDAVADAAPRLLGEIAALAHAFGWTEPEVLALPAARRAAYLEMVGA